MIEEERRLKASLENIKAAGKTIKGYDLQTGRLRDVIAQILSVSKTKVAQIESINNNLIPEFREELEKERLTFSAAYELSGMPEEEQKEAYDQYTDSGELSYINRLSSSIMSDVVLTRYAFAIMISTCSSSASWGDVILQVAISNSR